MYPTFTCVRAENSFNLSTFNRLMYNFQNIRVLKQWYGHLVNIYGNLTSSLLGIAFGYGYYLNKKTNFLQKYVRAMYYYYYYYFNYIP